MKRETFYKTAIIVLIVLNLLQVAGRFIARTPPGNPIELAIERLNLDNSQAIKFRKLAQNHRDKMVDLQNKQEKLTESYFNNPSDGLLNEVTYLEQEKVLATEKHFTAIKTILKKDQMKEFVKFKKNALNKIMRVKNKNKL